MNVIVGSTNRIKIEAVTETLQHYSLFHPVSVQGKNVSSQVTDQPKSLQETVQGAINRAKGVFEEGNISIGLESGLMPVPFTKTGFMDVCVCAIYDGKTIHLGLSQAFECPPEVVRLVHEKGYDLNQASNAIGLTTNPQLGAAEGIIGILTKGRVTRKDYTKEAIKMALIHLENREHYERP